MKVKGLLSNLKEKFSTLTNKEKLNRKRTLKATPILNNGVIVTFIIGSIISGIVDLVFFSGLSVAFYSLFGIIAIPAGLVLCLMSLVITSAKAWTSMKAEQIDELISTLKTLGYNCWQKLKPKKRMWKTVHAVCMAVSIMTAMSLSVVSIGDGIRKNQNEIRKANEEISTLAELINANFLGKKEQRNLVYSSVTSGTNSTKEANEKAKMIWPIIEEYRTERAEFQATGVAFSSKEEFNWRGETIIPNNYWDKQNDLVQAKVKAAGRTMTINQIRNITSEALLAQQIKDEIENVNKNTAKDDLILLDSQTKDEMTVAIENLQGRFRWPTSMGGELVVFDESNPSLALTTLKDLKAAYENDTGDVGESAKLFVLIGPAVEDAFKAKLTLENIAEKTPSSSSFGVTEVMIMFVILFFGLLQEVIIAILTPKMTITRNVFFHYNFDEKIDIEEILYHINLGYLKAGIINLEDFNAKVEKSKTIKAIPETLADSLKADKKKKPKEFTSKVDNEIKELEELLK